MKLNGQNIRTFEVFVTIGPWTFVFAIKFVQWTVLHSYTQGTGSTSTIIGKLIAISR